MSVQTFLQYAAAHDKGYSLYIVNTQHFSYQMLH